MKRRILWCTLLGSVGFVLCVLSLPRALPCALAWWRPDILFHDAKEKKILFLTIDDAPSPATLAIMAVLKKHEVPATFFVIGNRAQPDALLSSIVDAGFSLGHHMRTTKRCGALSFEQFRSDFDYTDHLLHRFSVPVYFRPPSDLGTWEQMSYVKSKGYQPVVGTVFPLDHWFQRPSVLTALIRWLALPGGIIIMHDGESRGRTTAQVLDEVLPLLKKSGYHFGVLGLGQKNWPRSAVSASSPPDSGV